MSINFDIIYKKKSIKKEKEICLIQLPGTAVRILQAIGEYDIASKSLENQFYVLQFVGFTYEDRINKGKVKMIISKTVVEVSIWKNMKTR